MTKLQYLEFKQELWAHSWMSMKYQIGIPTVFARKQKVLCNILLRLDRNFPELVTALLPQKPAYPPLGIDTCEKVLELLRQNRFRAAIPACGSFQLYIVTEPNSAQPASWAFQNHGYAYIQCWEAWSLQNPLIAVFIRYPSAMESAQQPALPSIPMSLH